MALVDCPECAHKVADTAPSCPNCGYHGRPGVDPGRGHAAEERTLWSGAPSLLLLLGKFFRLCVMCALAFCLWRFQEQIESFVGRHVDGVTEVLADHRQAFDKYVPLAAGTIAGIACLAFVIAVLRLKSLRYSLTTQRITVERGLIAKHVDDVDLRLIDETSFRQGIVQRLMGIGTVHVKSADENITNLLIRGIRSPRRVRELIRAQQYQASQRSLFMRQT